MRNGVVPCPAWLLVTPGSSSGTDFHGFDPSTLGPSTADLSDLVSNIFGIFTPKIGEDEPILTSICFKGIGEKPPTSKKVGEQLNLSRVLENCMTVNVFLLQLLVMVMVLLAAVIIACSLVVLMPLQIYLAILYQQNCMSLLVYCRFFLRRLSDQNVCSTVVFNCYMACSALYIPPA